MRIYREQGFTRSGIEGWLKVEVVAALGETVKGVHKGADLWLDGDDYLELKAATNFEPGGFSREHAKCRVYFCAFCSDESSNHNRLQQTLDFVASGTISDCRFQWMLDVARL